jgi:hypothetical protein
MFALTDIVRPWFGKPYFGLIVRYVKIDYIEYLKSNTPTTFLFLSQEEQGMKNKNVTQFPICLYTIIFISCRSLVYI